ncbi:hypothetical protein D3C78_1706560 [compost metagenome]
MGGRGGSNFEGTLAFDVQAFGFRWVAQAFVGASLVSHGEGKGALIVCRARQVDIDNAVVDLYLTEEFVVLLLTCG